MNKVFGQTFLLGNALVLAAALAYAGSTAQTSSLFFEAPPDAIRVKVLTSGGDYTANKTVTGTIQTSHDGTSWITSGLTTGAISSDSAVDVAINTPVMKYLRVEFTGTATATIAVSVFSDIPSGALSDGSIAQQDRGSSNGLVWCGCAIPLDAGITFAGSNVSGTAKQLPGPTATAGYIVLVMTGRTAGTVTPKIQWSADGSTFYDSGDSLGTLNSNGTTVFKLSKCVGGYIRLFYTQGSSFDGTIVTTLYTDGSWS